MKKLDITAWIGIIACLGILGFSVQQNQKTMQKRLVDARAAAEAKKAAEELAAANPTEPGSPQTAPTAAPEVGQPVVASEQAELVSDLFKLTLTNRGAGIQTAQLLKFNKVLKDNNSFITVNETRETPIGAFSSKPNEIDLSLWRIQSKSEKSVTFAADTPDKLHVEKTFRIPDEDRPYEVEMDVAIRNDSGAPIELSNTQSKFIYVGGAAPLEFNELSMQIGLFYREQESTFVAKTVDYFKKGFFSSEKPYAILPGTDELADNLAFAGVNDLFFATLLQAKEPRDGQVWAGKYPVVINGDEAQSTKKKIRGCELAMGLPNLALNPGDNTTLSYKWYIGPKDTQILRQSPEGWNMIMNYDQIPIFGKIFGWAIKPLAAMLSWSLVHLKNLVGNYGWSIILLTILVRLLMWPVYAKSARSMKRMSKLAPLQKAIKEKYPDDPQKVNKETMQLYSEYGINPMGGCLPMLVQLPVFLGFYRMLSGAVELRHEPFGFVQDLTMPDNFATIPGFGALNILPILMAIASFIQMAMIPKTGDNTQRMIFMMMPLIFLFFCYQFAAGLSLYWTVSNVFTIAQTWLMNKLPEPELVKSNQQKKSKPGLMAKLQEKIEAAQAQHQGGGGTDRKQIPTSDAKKAPELPPIGQSRTKLASEKGSRHTKGKKKRR